MDGGPLKVDVAVVGGGPVGAAFALAATRSGLSVAIIENREPTLPEGHWDGRVYAISPENVSWLAEMGAWQHIEPGRVQPVLAMRIQGDMDSGQLDFSAADGGETELAHIVETGRLQQAIWQAAGEAGSVRLCPAHVKSLAISEEQAALRLTDGARVMAKLVVGADGARSWVRQTMAMTCRMKPYHHLGVVANFATALPHDGVAWEWFRHDGVLAWLPLPGQRMSMVWSTEESQGQKLLALSDSELADRVARAGHHALGELSVITPAQSFPLRLAVVDPLVKPRVALLGDAAHGVHPLAGQGVNLGLRDARELALVLAGRGPRDCGDHFLLRRYERERKADILRIQALTDGLLRLFNARDALVATTRNMGMALIQRQPWLKRILVQQALH